MAECCICGAEVNIGEGAVKGELIECAECGTELELVEVDPPRLAEAPSEEEDWGQ